jgi:aldehyde dehydrogenase (NAD+)
MNTDLFINNEWRPATGAKKFDVINPATEEVAAQVAEADASDVDAAVGAARTCFESDEWRKLSGRKRGAMLAKAADILASRLDEVAKLETVENGKPFFESKIDVSMTIETLRYYAGWADKLSGETVPVEGPYFTYIRREPVGVVGAIVPWNFPLNIAGWKFSPALAAGCTVVLKPATETPLTALAMADVMRDAGLPAGAFNVVPGAGSTAGAALVRHPGVDKISFTGSTEVGKRLMSWVARVPTSSSRMRTWVPQ